MLTEAGIASVMLTPLSYDGATNPMLIVGVLYLASGLGVRTQIPFRIGLLRVVVLSGAFALAIVSLLLFTEGRCIFNETGASSCKDAAITLIGNGVGLGSLAFGFWVSRSWSTPIEN